MVNTRAGLLLLLAAASASAAITGVGCSSSKSNGPNGTATPTPSGISGVAHVIQGATVPAALQFAAAAALPSDGNWKVTPNKVAVTITRLNLHGLDAANDTGSDLVDCTVTYDRANTSGNSLLDC